MMSLFYKLCNKGYKLLESDSNWESYVKHLILETLRIQEP